MIGQALWIVCIGRFIWGISFGAFSVVCAKYVNEIVPIELSGSFGAINQMSLTFGIALPSTMALAYPSDILETGHTGDFYVEQYWRVIWCLPLFCAVLQVALMGTCFRFESPVYLHEQGREEELLTVMKKYYTGGEVRKRIDTLQRVNSKEGNADAQEATIMETFFDPDIRGAAWVGFFMCTIQQFTGMNAILFYSAQLFGSDDGGMT